MTIGRNNEAPAAYALTSTISRLLDHLKQVDLYSQKDLDHITHTLGKLREITKKESDHSPKLVTLVSNRIDVCQHTLDELIARLGRLHGDMPKIHEKLISILRSLSLANTRTKACSQLQSCMDLTGFVVTHTNVISQFSSKEVTKLQDQLKEIDAQRLDGKFVSSDGTVPQGNEEVCTILHRVLEWSEIVLER